MAVVVVVVVIKVVEDGRVRLDIGEGEAVCCISVVQLVVVGNIVKQLCIEWCEFGFVLEGFAVKVQQLQVLDFTHAAHCDVHLSACEELIITKHGDPVKG